MSNVNGLWQHILHMYIKFWSDTVEPKHPQLEENKSVMHAQ